MNKDNDSTMIFNIYNEGQLNVASDSSTINATQNNKQDSGKEEPSDIYKKIKKIENLNKRSEFEKAKELLFDLETNNLSAEQEFLKDLYLGECYIFPAQDCKENNKKELLQKGFLCLKDAKKNWQNQKDEYIYYFYHLYINVCLQLAELEKRIDYYIMGIELYNKGILDTKKRDFSDPERYRLLLDYALLLDGASKYSKGKEAKDYLIEESNCYYTIFTLEELMNKGIDEESAYRYFVNAGRCFEQLLEFSDEDSDQLADSAVEFYKNALDPRLVSLNKFPDRYGMVYNNLGNVYSRIISRGKSTVTFEMARDCYDKAWKAYDNIKDMQKCLECRSNKARLLISNYKKRGTKKGYEEIEDLLKSIIQERKNIDDIYGSYLSNLQLAQLYFDAGVKNSDGCMLQKSMSICSDVLDYYTKEYVPDLYFKTLYCRYRASSSLAEMQKDITVVKKNIEEILDVLQKNKGDLSENLVLLNADLVQKLFFIYVELNECGEEKLEEVYIKIKTVFNKIDLNIEDYIEKI